MIPVVPQQCEFGIQAGMSLGDLGRYTDREEVAAILEKIQSLRSAYSKTLACMKEADRDGNSKKVAKGLERLNRINTDGSDAVKEGERLLKVILSEMRAVKHVTKDAKPETA